MSIAWCAKPNSPNPFPVFAFSQPVSVGEIIVEGLGDTRTTQASRGMSTKQRWPIFPGHREFAHTPFWYFTASTSESFFLPSLRPILLFTYGVTELFIKDMSRTLK